MNDYVTITSPIRTSDKRTKRRLRIDLASWQWAALGLLVLSVLVNTFQTARIAALEAARREDAAAYQERVESAEHIRDLAVRELGAMALQAEEERQARVEQAAAYEAVGSYRYIGGCQVTYYCSCAECCGQYADGLTATGIPASPGVVAVDPEVIPLGSTVVIDGQKYLAADTGVTGRWVDVCAADHQEAVERGVGTADVWVVE